MSNDHLSLNLPLGRQAFKLRMSPGIEVVQAADAGTWESRTIASGGGLQAATAKGQRRLWLIAGLGAVATAVVVVAWVTLRQSAGVGSAAAAPDVVAASVQATEAGTLPVARAGEPLSVVAATFGRASRNPPAADGASEASVRESSTQPVPAEVLSSASVALGRETAQDGKNATSLPPLGLEDASPAPARVAAPERAVERAATVAPAAPKSAKVGAQLPVDKQGRKTPKASSEEEASGSGVVIDEPPSSREAKPAKTSDPAGSRPSSPPGSTGGATRLVAIKDEASIVVSDPKTGLPRTVRRGDTTPRGEKVLEVDVRAGTVRTDRGVLSLE